MLTKSEIQVLIVMRLLAACKSCNAVFIEGQIIGLLAVLTGGKRYESDGDCRKILNKAEIPWDSHPDDEDGWIVPEKWLLKNGCTIEDDPNDEEASIIKYPKKLKEWAS